MKRRLAVVVPAVIALGACSKDPVAKPPPLVDGIELPVVTGASYAPIEPHAPLVGATPTSLAFDGKPVVSLVKGAVAAADKEGGEQGIKIQRLSTVLALHMDTAPRPPLQLALDRSLTYGLLVEIMYSAKQPAAGWKTFELLAKAGSGTVAVRITLPDKTPASAALKGSLSPDALAAPGDDEALAKRIPTKPILKCYQAMLEKDSSARGKVTMSFSVDRAGKLHDAAAHGFADDLDACIQKALLAWKAPGEGGQREVAIRLVPDDGGRITVASPPSAPPPDMPLGIVVSVAKDELLVWSFSQLEGSIREPKLRVDLTSATALEQVSGALAEIVKRRWPGARPDGTKTIVFMADRATSMQRVAELLGAVRPAFPDVVFSSGFE